MAASKAKTLADFRAAHDPDVMIPNRIRAGLAAIEKEGPEHYLYGSDFLKLTGLSTTQLAAYREQFAAHIVDAPLSGSGGRSSKRAYFGNAKVAAKLKPSK
jgi:hypothetical protein